MHSSETNTSITLFEPQILVKCKSTSRGQLCFLPCARIQNRIRCNYHSPREEISRPWPVRWWDCTRNQHIFTQIPNSNYPSWMHWIIRQSDWLLSRGRDFTTPMTTSHCALSDDLHKNPNEEVPASQSPSPNSSLVKQPTLLQIGEPPFWFLLHVCLAADKQSK